MRKKCKWSKGRISPPRLLCAALAECFCEVAYLRATEEVSLLAHTTPSRLRVRARPWGTFRSVQMMLLVQKALLLCGALGARGAACACGWVRVCKDPGSTRTIPGHFPSAVAALTADPPPPFPTPPPLLPPQPKNGNDLLCMGADISEHYYPARSQLGAAPLHPPPLFQPPPRSPPSLPAIFHNKVTRSCSQYVGG